MSHLLRTLAEQDVNSKEWQDALAAAIATCPQRLLLLVQGVPEPNAHLLELLTDIFETTARVAPTLDVVPLLPFAGWTEELVAEMISVSVLLTPPRPLPQDLQLYQRLLRSAGPDNTPQLVQLDVPAAAAEAPAAPPCHTAAAAALAAPPCHTAAAALSAAASPEAAAGTSSSSSSGACTGAGGSVAAPATMTRSNGTSVAAAAAAAAAAPPAGGSGGGGEVYAFKRVAVGGTFDRLHAGHRLLLAAAAAVCTGTLYIGVTADALLASKSDAALLQSYRERAQGAEGYVRAVRPGLVVETGALRDPKAPTAAELQRDMEAIVVSHETLPGANAINAGRAARGFPLLRVLVVGLVGVSEQGAKLSSSALRSLEAARQAQQQQQQWQQQQQQQEEEEGRVVLHAALP